MSSRIGNILRASARYVKSLVGSDGLRFLLSLLVSALFWFLLTINEDSVNEFHITVNVENVPDDVSMVAPPPGQITVMARDRGTSFLKFVFSSDPVISVNFNDYRKHNNVFSMSRTELLNHVRDVVGNTATIISINPDSIRATYTTLPPRKVKLVVNSDVTPSNECVLSGRAHSSVDSVLVYSTTPLPTDFDRVETVLVYATGLKDTTVFKANIKPVSGMRFEPSSVDVTIPVEPLIRKQMSVPVVVDNLPFDVNLITFPSAVTINYLIPMSFYKRAFSNVKAHVDYNMVVDANSAAKLPVILLPIPDLFRDVSVSPDSIDYLIEKH